MGLAVASWGPSAATSFVVNSSRPSTYLSIFYTFRTSLSFVPASLGLQDFDALSLPAMCVLGGAVLWYGWSRNIDVTAAAAAGLAAMILSYKVGHTQFLVVVLYLVCYWLVARRSTRHNTPIKLVAPLLLLWGWLCLIEMVYPLTVGMTRPPWDRVMTYLGIPTSLLGGWMIVAILVMAARDARQFSSEKRVECPRAQVSVE
jgi:hypothetical protein